MTRGLRGRAMKSNVEPDPRVARCALTLGYCLTSLQDFHWTALRAATRPGRPTARVSLLTAHCLKSCRPLTHHAESSFERNAHLSNQTIIEQSSEKCDPMRDTPRGIELGQRIIWIGGPVAARF